MRYNTFNCKRFLAMLSATAIATMALYSQTSPNGKIAVKTAGKNGLAIYHNSNESKLTKLAVIECGNIKKTVVGGTHTTEYDMLTGKRSHCSNACSEAMYVLADGDTLTVRAWNDGVAWRGTHDSRINLSGATHNWLAEWSDGYEAFFPADRNVTEGNRFCYPALFEFGSDKDTPLFLLLSESGIDRNCAASSLHATATPGTFALKPDGPEMPGWQTAIIGSLAEIVESTLIADNSAPSQIKDTSWIHPGVASWVYWAYNHGSENYDIVCKYIDLAATLKLPYVLIDADWDKMGNGKNILDAVGYAKEKGIKPMIWYNSSVGWIDGAPGPKFRLNKPEDREREFAWCEQNGIVGVKVDFFSGDTNLNIRYMTELLECAARHNLLVNFHGATIPRGWHRTYPNLMSVEGVYGAEWYNNVPTFTDKAARHNATLPFTRNVIGPMDYTPCAFSDSQHPHITTHAHELALTVLYESGIQHLADRPESFLAQPEYIRNFLTQLPNAWDDTKLIGGYPGDYAVIARRKGNNWWIAGINGNDTVREIPLDFNKTGITNDYNNKKITLIADYSKGKDSKWEIRTIKDLPQIIRSQPRGGFIITIQEL